MSMFLYEFSFHFKYFPPVRENFTLFSIFVQAAEEMFNLWGSSFNPRFVSYILIFNTGY